MMGSISEWGATLTEYFIPVRDGVGVEDVRKLFRRRRRRRGRRRRRRRRCPSRMSYKTLRILTHRNRCFYISVQTAIY